MIVKNVNNDVITAIVDGAGVIVQPGDTIEVSEEEGYKCKQNKGCVEVTEAKVEKPEEVPKEEEAVAEAEPVEEVPVEVEEKAEPVPEVSKKRRRKK